MRRHAVTRLFRLHLLRTLAPMGRLTLAIAVLWGLMFLWKGLRGGLTAALGGVWLAYFPGGLAMNMIQEKTDGSLRFLSSLPVTGREHAASRALAVVVLTIPLAIYVSAAFQLSGVLPLPGAVASGIGCGVAVIVGCLVLIALLYKFSIQKAVGFFRWLFLGFLAATFVLPELLAKIPWPEGFLEALISPVGIAALALLAGMGVAATGWYAIRTIVVHAPAYDREEEAIPLRGGGGPWNVVKGIRAAFGRRR